MRLRTATPQTKTNKVMSFDIGEYWSNKKAIVVPEDIGDDKCGLYAIAIAELNPPKNPGRITKAIKSTSRLII